MWSMDFLQRCEKREKSNSLQTLSTKLMSNSSSVCRNYISSHQKCYKNVFIMTFFTDTYNINAFEYTRGHIIHIWPETPHDSSEPSSTLTSKWSFKRGSEKCQTVTLADLSDVSTTTVSKCCVLEQRKHHRSGFSARTCVFVSYNINMSGQRMVLSVTARHVCWHHRFCEFFATSNHKVVGTFTYFMSRNVLF